MIFVVAVSVVSVDHTGRTVFAVQESDVLDPHVNEKPYSTPIPTNAPSFLM